MMIKYFSKESINQLLSNFNILNELAKYIKIKKMSYGYSSICPFHKEKTPSFFINENKQRYYCFGCNRSGNLITFIMEFKNLNFLNSINFLNKQLCEKSININLKENKHNFNIYDLTKKISYIYKKNLEQAAINNLEIKNFLFNRGLNKQIINDFDIGFASNSWNFILNKFKNNLKIIKHLEKIGILIKKTNTYDRFRNRIMFPIKNINGNVIAFGARSLSNNIKPKYINSSESYIFSKKSELYGLYESINNEKKNYVIIVEGYLDVLSLYKKGIKNVVGILGTSFTNIHLKKLKKFYNKIFFCFDGDSAGKYAATRAAYTCLTHMNKNIFIGFVNLPENEDPDSYIKKFGKKNFLFLVKKSSYIFDYLYKNIIINLKIESLYNKLFILENIQNITKKIPNLAFRDIIFTYLKKKLYYRTFYKKNLFLNSENNNLSLEIKASILLLKNRSFVYKIDIKKLILNKNIKFISRKNAFLELVILIKRNINFNFNKVKFKILSDQKIINKNLKNNLFNLKKDILLDEFMFLLNKIYEK